MAESDSQIVEKILSGDTTAFDELMKRYQRLVYSIAMNYVGLVDDAMDITQMVFMTTFKKLKTVQEPAQIKHWIIRVTYNTCASQARKTIAMSSLEVVADPQDQGHGDQAIHQQTLSKLLDQLNPKHRLAIILKYIEGYPIREIADVLSCSEGNVKNMLYRSMQKLSAIAQ